MADQQNYSNHVRWYPLVHFVILPIFVLNLVYQVVRLVQEPSLDRGVWVVLCAGFVLLTFTSRTQALKAQDRVIRLEEQLRYYRVLPPELADTAASLRPGQVIALRFAPNDELAALVEQIATGKLSTSKEIKMAVKNWRGDHLRV